MKGLYGNSLEEAWYGGYVCDGSKPSTVHFTKANLPPGKFFWSMTMHTIPDRFLYANPLNRYSIGDRTKGAAIWHGWFADGLCEQRFTGERQGKQLAAGAGGEVQLGRARLWAEQSCNDRSVEAAAAGASELTH
jgi:hypothetical protein